MATLQFWDSRGRPINPAMTSNRETWGMGLIDGRVDRCIVVIAPDAAHCPSCRATDCGHITEVERILREFDLALTRGGGEDEKQ